MDESTAHRPLTSHGDGSEVEQAPSHENGHQQHLVVRHKDVTTTEPGLRLETLTPDEADRVVLQLGDTPGEYMHVLTGLERISRLISDTERIRSALVDAEWPYIMGVTSAVEGEGKTTTALHMALTIARCTPKRVCLVDLNPGPHSLTEQLFIPVKAQNLVTAIEGECDTISYFSVPDHDNLTVVPAGPPPSNLSKFVRRPRVAQFLNATRRMFDIVIVDMPAVSTENVVPLARLMDGVMMVVWSGVTPREVVSDAIEVLGSDSVKCALLNRGKSSTPQWFRKKLGVL